jgi:hypothetical protein
LSCLFLDAQICTLTPLHTNKYPNHHPTVDEYCPGGDFANEGRTQTECPGGTTTDNKENKSQRSDCEVPPGYSWNGARIVECGVAFYCPGGPLPNDENVPGPQPAPCPTGTTTSGEASSTETQCNLVLPGYYMLNGVATICPVDNYCPGGLITGDNAPGKTLCPTGTGTNAQTGQAAEADCDYVKPGYYMLNGDVTVCPVDNYCPGGLITGDNAPGKTLCPTGTGTNAQTGQAAEADCDYVKPGYYFDPNSGTSGAVLDCPGES